MNDDRHNNTQHSKGESRDLQNIVPPIDRREDDDLDTHYLKFTDDLELVGGRIPVFRDDS